MKQYESIGSMIQWIIECRGKTDKQVGAEMGFKPNTFSYQLKNDKMSVDTLFKLAAYLDIDLNWMMVVLGYHGPVSPFEKEITPRMSPEFRAIEAKAVEKHVDQIILENPTSTADARREILNQYKTRLFYLLDVLVPEERNIYMTTERGQTKFMVEGAPRTMQRRYSTMNRRCVNTLYTVAQAIEQLIEERKERR